MTRAYYHDSLEEAQEMAMNEANTHVEAIGPAGTSLDGMSHEAARSAGEKIVDGIVLGFVGYLTVELPELHGVTLNRIAAAWGRFKASTPPVLFQDER